MYPLTIGLAIENRELLEQAQSALGTLPFRVIVEHNDVGDVSNFLDKLERMRPDVVLVDISTWKESLEGLVASIRNAAELSTTVTPAAAYPGASAREVPAPALKSATSRPVGSALAASSTRISRSPNGSRFPADRAEAKNRR